MRVLAEKSQGWVTPDSVAPGEVFTTEDGSAWIVLTPAQKTDKWTRAARLTDGKVLDFVEGSAEKVRRRPDAVLVLDHRGEK